MPRPATSSKMISRTKMPSRDQPVFSAAQATSGIKKSATPASARDQRRLIMEDNFRTPRLCFAITVSHMHRLHGKPGGNELAPLLRTIRFKCHGHFLLLRKTTRAWSRHGG